MQKTGIGRLFYFNKKPTAEIPGTVGFDIALFYFCSAGGTEFIVGFKFLAAHTAKIVA